MERILFSIFLFIGIYSNAQLSDLYKVSKVAMSDNDFSEYNVQLVNDNAYFISNRNASQITKITDMQNQELYGIFLVSNINAALKTPTRLPIKLDRHIGSFCISKDENNIFFTSESLSYPGKFAIYNTIKEKSEWSKPKEVLSNQNFNYLDPNFSISEDSLFFVSDANGGLGGLDIYIGKVSNKSIVSIANLGENINTIYDERYPSFSENLLFYSSKKSGNHQNLDIFSSLIKEGKAMTAFKLPYPVNSEFDDFALSRSKDGKWYFTSARNGSDDIYEINYNFPVTEYSNFKPVERCFEFYETNADFEDTTLFTFQWNMGDGTKYWGLEAKHCFADSGLYIVDLNVVDKQSKEVFYNQASYEFLIEDAYQLPLVFPDTVNQGMIKLKLEKVFEADSSKIYWDMGDGNLYAGLDVEHNYSTEGEYVIKVNQNYYNNGQMFAIGTSKNIIYKKMNDSSQTSKLLYAPSENYLNNIKETLTQDDITKIKYLLEVISSTEEIDVSDEYFEKLSEYYLIEKHYDSRNEKYSYTVGNENSATALYDVYSKTKSLGYQDAKVVDKKFIVLTLQDLDTVQAATLEYALIKIPEILFASNSYKIPESSFNNLNLLADFIKRFPEIKIEISAHTDNVGREDKNLILSELRAQAIADYLNKQFINLSRFIVKGFGDSKPIVANDSDENKSMNRRVEFRVTK